MLLLDYITMNSDRHRKNFCLIQDTRTGKILGPAPIFDNGSSMFTVIRAFNNDPFLNVTAAARLFISPHEGQIMLSDLTPFLKGLRQLKPRMYDLVCDCYLEKGPDDEYVYSMAELILQRISNLL